VPKRAKTVVDKLGRIPELRIAAAGRIGLGVAQGFLILLLVFSLRESHEPAWWFYALIGAALLGGVVGDLLVPRLPEWVREEAIVLGSLVAAGIGALIAFEFFGFWALLAYTAIAGLMTEFGRLAFQARMQRVVPEKAHGRVFARYEVAFQLAWVAGAFIPALFPIDFRAGILIMGAFYLFVAATWMVRPMAAQRRADRDKRPESGNPFV
jgi:MFS family permease